MKIKFININMKEWFKSLLKEFYNDFTWIQKIVKFIFGIFNKKIFKKLFMIIIIIIAFASIIRYFNNYNEIIIENIPVDYDVMHISEKEPVLENVNKIENVNKTENVNIEEEKIIPTKYNISKINNFADLQKYVYTVDKTAFVTMDDFPIDEFLQIDFKVDLNTREPKVLIFHTHSQETFVDSRDGFQEDTIVGVGTELSEILVNNYGIAVVHDIGKYDFVDGKVERGKSYENMEPAVKKILEKYPTIEIAIDLHRDAIEGTKLLTEIDSKQTAKIMFFNGVTRENIKGKPKDVESLTNPFIKENLALSLQLFLCSNELYPDFARRNYIKPYRYSLHLMPKSMLVEVGANTNTLQEAKNAMKPLAEILVNVLSNQ